MAKSSLLSYQRKEISDEEELEISIGKGNFTPSNEIVMARIAGIKFENDTQGRRRYVRIDLKKHSADINPLLEKLGALEQDDFERRWAEGITIEEAKQQSRDFLMNHDYWRQQRGKG